MAVSAQVQKTLVMTSEVSKIFDDLEQWLDHCRFNLLPFNPSDLYRSVEYKNFQRGLEYNERKARREARSAQGK